MAETLIQLQRKKKSAADLSSVVRVMKAMAMSNITQFELAVNSLQEYYRTISYGLYACMTTENISIVNDSNLKGKPSVVVIFGSDQGLVGRFNDSIYLHAQNTLKELPGEIEVWAIGERIYALLMDEGIEPTKYFNVPNSVEAITPLVNQILIESEKFGHGFQDYNLFIFHNQPVEHANYKQQNSRLFPPDSDWEKSILEIQWPNQSVPQVIGQAEDTMRVLIREYLFVSLYKACAESLAAENASRLDAMERAEKNIEEVVDELDLSYNRLRQSMIDGELFDLIAGFEALKKDDN